MIEQSCYSPVTILEHLAPLDFVVDEMELLLELLLRLVIALWCWWIYVLEATNYIWVRVSRTCVSTCPSVDLTHNHWPSVAWTAIRSGVESWSVSVAHAHSYFSTANSLPPLAYSSSPPALFQLVTLSIDIALFHLIVYHCLSATGWFWPAIGILSWSGICGVSI